jgi:hypothetical protein
MDYDSDLPGFSTCSIPDGSYGDWSVDTFTLTEDDILMANLRALRDEPLMYCPPGTYRRLAHKNMGVVMSNTRMERITNYEAVFDATGNVLISGLGLGLVLEAILSKPDVKHVTVLEVDADLLNLVGVHFADRSRVTLIHADACTWVPPKGSHWDYAWHDIWNTLDTDNLPLMAKVTRRFGKFCTKQGVWSRSHLYRMRRRESRY